MRARDGGAPPRSEAAERVYDTIRKPLDGEISTEDFLCPAAAENFARQDFFFMGFILLRVLEFFVFRKMEMPETKNHLLCGWRQSVVQKNHLSVTIELFRHYCKKGKVILWRIRIMI